MSSCCLSSCSTVERQQNATTPRKVLLEDTKNQYNGRKHNCSHKTNIPTGLSFTGRWVVFLWPVWIWTFYCVFQRKGWNEAFSFVKPLFCWILLHFPFNPLMCNNSCKSYKQIAVGEMTTATIRHCRVWVRFPDVSDWCIPWYGFNFGKYRAVGFLQVVWWQRNFMAFKLSAACKRVKVLENVPKPGTSS